MGLEEWLAEERHAIAMRRARLRAAQAARRPPLAKEERAGEGSGNAPEPEAPQEIGTTYGLALSGGGIRSATFCLGLIKSLAKNRVLTRFDYLSTVSGGGYAGAALGRLFQSVRDPLKVQEELARDDRLFWWWLRSNGRYLLPAGAKDTFFAMSTQFRNLVAVYFELFLLTVVASCLLVLPHIGGMLAVDGAPYDWISEAPSVWVLPLQAIPLLVLTATWAYWFSRPDNAWRIYRVSVLFAIVASLALFFVLWPAGVRALLVDWNLAANVSTEQWCVDATRNRSWLVRPFAEFTCLTVNAQIALSQLLASIPLAVLLAYFAGKPKDKETRTAPSVARKRLTVSLTNLLQAALAVSAAALVDLASWWLAHEYYREGWQMFATGGATVGMLIVAGRALLKWVKDQHFSGAGISVTLLANLAGFALLGAFVLVCASFVQLVVFYGGGFTDSEPRLLEPRLWANESMARWLLLFVPCAAYVLLTGGKIGSLNASSLHNFYHARLTRSYVSVGNPDRGFRPDALAQASFGAVDALEKVSEVVPTDDIALSQYAPHQEGGPLHLINACFNQTLNDRTKEFNRDRKGRNLSVSSVGLDVGASQELSTVAFAPAPTLGQWVSISGAAAAPGMGSNTAKGLAALLTLCGVRLGYWLTVANRPLGLARERLAKYVHLLDETFATFPGSAHRHWYVSDGGHFDNTGIYALLKRRVDVIVAADCGADPKYAFADLNNLVRLARIDLNARITFLKMRKEGQTRSAIPLSAFGTLAEVASPESSSYLILAQVQYEGREAPGYIIILKPALIDSLPLDLLSYKSANPAFPQQTTADQFFDEAQWESYFRLGEELGSAITVPMLEKAPVMAESFEGQLGTGLAQSGMSSARSPREPSPRLVRDVVKSSLSVGAVAGALIAVWQTLDQYKARQIAELARYNSAIAKAVERSQDANGVVRPSTGANLYLRTVMGSYSHVARDPQADMAEELICSLQNRCALDPSVGDGTAQKDMRDACAEIVQWDRRFNTVGGLRIVDYWPGKDGPGAAQPAEPRKRMDSECQKSPRFDTVAAVQPREESTPPVPAPPQQPLPDVRPDLDMQLYAGNLLCGGEGARVHLYPEVYTDVEKKRLEDLAKEPWYLRFQQYVLVEPVDDVVASARKQGVPEPYRWSAPTLIYHNESDRACAETIAQLYALIFQATPAIRPLPAKLRKQPRTLELWVPPDGAVPREDR